MTTTVQILLLASVPAMLAAFAACGHPCDASARASVTLEIVDAATGAPFGGARVTYTLDDDPTVITVDDPNDNFFFLAYETVGIFHVTVEGENYETQELEYEVDHGECHVNAVHDVVEMVPTS